MNDSNHAIERLQCARLRAGSLHEFTDLIFKTMRGGFLLLLLLLYTWGKSKNEKFALGQKASKR